MKDTPHRLRKGMNSWPTLRFAGIRVDDIAEDWSSCTVSLRISGMTKNKFGTAFGGSLSAMTDPFYMLMLNQQLGRDYVVWDTAGEIQFVKPGRNKVTAHMAMPSETVDKIRTETADGSKSLTWFETDIIDQEGDVVAHVRRQVYARRKRETGSRK